MLDAENLCKLIRKIPPDICRAFLNNHCSVSIPVLDTKQNLTQQRAAISSVLTALSIAERQQIEQIAESIIMLSDALGRDALANVCTKNISADNKATLDAISNQCLRALWFFENEHTLFLEALSVRQADSFRQSRACYSGFVAPPNLEIHKDEKALDDFHSAVAERLECAKQDVAIQLFCRLRADAKSHDDTVLYQVSIHHNLLPETIECVQDSEVVANDIIRAISTHVTYEPNTGHLEVLSKKHEDRAPIASLFAGTILATPFEGQSIPIKQYDYQSLASPKIFNVAGEPVQSVKVTELGYDGRKGGASLTKMKLNTPGTIYQRARELYDDDFAFSDHTLTYAKISIKLKKQGTERARTVSIIFSGENQCNIKSKRKNDRALCDRLLAKWEFIKEIGDADQFVTA